jgi:hypothetical protein
MFLFLVSLFLSRRRTLSEIVDSIDSTPSLGSDGSDGR